MIKKYNNTSLLFGVPGIILQVVGNVIWRTGESSGWSMLGLPLAFAGTALLIVGLSFYAMAKGHSWIWGLCGFFSCIGLLILALLPDRQLQG